MKLETRITRLPTAFDVDLGAEAADAVPEASADLRALLIGTAGSSPYLKGLIERERDWLPAAAEAPEAAMEAVMADLGTLSRDQLKPGMRQAKRRVALLTALADLAGVWPLETVTGHLTALADLTAELALQAEIAKLIGRDKIPGQTEKDISTAGGMVVLAMGKMGAGELNYSSDIDLICLFDETRFAPDTFYEARQAFVRATRAMCATLSDHTSDGYVFRTDLRLRPDPAVTPVCIAMEAAERYYESLGRTWERAAFIKARPAAGDRAAGERFLKTLTPFVWRRHLDFAAIQDAHDMRLRIRETKGLSGPITIPGHDLKLGRGGIREIEFFTQTRQLIAGGRDPSLRSRETIPGLQALAVRGWVPQDVADKLADHYRALREAEHRVQMIQDAQTHKLPSTQEGMARLAALMGRMPEDLSADLSARLTEVHRLTEDFFAPDAQRSSKPAPEPSITFDAKILARWPTYPAFRSERARRIFDRLRPELLSQLSKAAKPEEALIALDGFLAGLPAGVQLFSLFEANPQLIDLLVDIVGTAPELAGFLSRNSAVFDAVIGGDFFAPWPGKATLQADLPALLAAEPDYETQLDAARRWMKEWHFRIGVHFLRGLIDGQTAGRQYAELADAVLAAVTPIVVAEFSRRHGPPPGRGAAVVGMGSLGAGQLNPRSDLDVIVVYDPQDVETSEGPRSLATRPYYARLTQALITAMTAPMSQGRLYEVDMRLRPSGNQGPVATSWRSFREYQQNEAWIWEHLALTRARVVAGSEPLAEDIERFRESVLVLPRERAAVLEEVATMRARIAAAKSPESVWDAKTGAGRLQDIELLSQTGALLAKEPTREVAEGLQGAVTAGLLEAQAGAELIEHYRLLWNVAMAVRLVSNAATEDDVAGDGTAAFLCRATGFAHLDDLRAALEAAYRDAAACIDKALGRAEGTS